METSEPNGADRRALAATHRAWLKSVLTATGLTANGLAERAGLSASTLYKPLNDEDWANALSAGTIQKITTATGLPGPGATTGGMREPDAIPYEVDDTSPFDRAIRALIDGRNDVHPWEIRGRSVDKAGLVPGDVALVDLQAEPKPGDVVVAQLYSRHGAETVFRLFNGRHLSTFSTSADEPHIAVPDGETVAIRGVVTESLSPRRNAA